MRLLAVLLPTLALFSPLLNALTTWESIHQTLNLYPLAIDSKDFGLLSQVFTPSAFANYGAPLNDLQGLLAIQAGLSASVAKVNSQHLLGTTLIDIQDDEGKSNATTYVQATLFGNPYSIGSIVTLYGYYADDLVKIGYKKWLISKRLFILQGPGIVGNFSLLGA